jgi:Fe-S cluster assembly scaffold protein SufB
MLDASAKVDAIPALEIKTNDVKASHSASITKISPETLFYLQSRGIEEAAARSMFVEGFLGELLRNLPADAIGKA